MNSSSTGFSSTRSTKKEINKTYHKMMMLTAWLVVVVLTSFASSFCPENHRVPTVTGSTLVESLLRVIRELKWSTVTVISGGSQETVDSIIRELQILNIPVIIFAHNETLRGGGGRSTKMTSTSSTVIPHNLTNTDFPSETIETQTIAQTLSSTEKATYPIQGTNQENRTNENLRQALDPSDQIHGDDVRYHTASANEYEVTIENGTSSSKIETLVTASRKDTDAADGLLQEVMSESENFLVLGSSTLVRQVFQKMLDTVKASQQEYRLFETQWLTALPETSLDVFTQEVTSFEHVVVVTLRETTPVSLSTLQRSGDTTRLALVTSLGDAPLSTLRRDRLLPNLSQGLSGRTLSVVVKERSYFITKVNGRYEGVLIDLLQVLSNQLNFTYTLTTPADDSWGQVLDNGEWDGAIGMLTRHEVDLGVGSFSETAERSEVCDATSAYLYDYSRLLFRQASPLPDAWAFFLQPFHALVYLTTAVSFVCVLLILNLVHVCRARRHDDPEARRIGRGRKNVGVLVTAIQTNTWIFNREYGSRNGSSHHHDVQKKTEYTDPPDVRSVEGQDSGSGEAAHTVRAVGPSSGVRTKSETERVLDDAETLLAGLINRPQEYVDTSDAGRTLMLSWLLLGVMLAALYGSKLTATLTAPDRSPPFSSLAGLIAQGSYTWGIASGTAKLSLFSFYQGLMMFNETDPSVTSSDTEVQKQKVLTGNYAFFTGSRDLYDAWHAESCDVNMITENNFRTSKVFYLQKGSPFTKAISNEIERMLMTGLVTYWIRLWLPANPLCGDVSANDVTGSDGTVTGLRDIQSAFYLLGVGVGAAALALGLELTWCLWGWGRGRSPWRWPWN